MLRQSRPANRKSPSQPVSISSTRLGTGNAVGGLDQHDDARALVGVAELLPDMPRA